MTTDLLQRLTSLVGPAGVITGGSDLEPYAVDWRKLFPGKPACVVRPT
jgi:FAD/FMN-containing dehydrogenase